MSVSRVGLTGIEKVIRIGVDRRSAQPFSARIDCFLDPGPAAGRFEDAIRDVVRGVVDGADGARAERLAQRMAERLRERLRASSAVVTLSARFPEDEQRIATLHAGATACERDSRWTVGVSVRGVTTSPSPHDARERLAAEGFSEDRIARALSRIPVATHDQLALGTLHVGCPASSALEFDAVDLWAIVEAALSSEIFDGVRAMIAGVVQRYAGLPDDVFVHAAQEDVGRRVVAARAGLLGDLRRKLAT